MGIRQGKPLRLRNRSLNTIPLSINYNLIRSVRSIWNVPHARSVVSPRSSRGARKRNGLCLRPSYQPGNLLRDTLYIKQKRQSQALENLAGKNTFPLLPIRMGSRFWVSTYYNAEDESRNYTFCYDTEKEECWQVKEGLKDNFYQTGNVRRMDPIDPYCHSYCFSKSGEDLRNTFPHRPKGKASCYLS